MGYGSGEVTISKKVLDARDAFESVETADTVIIFIGAFSGEEFDR